MLRDKIRGFCQQGLLYSRPQTPTFLSAGRALERNGYGWCKRTQALTAQNQTVCKRHRVIPFRYCLKKNRTVPFDTNFSPVFSIQMESALRFEPVTLRVRGSSNKPIPHHPNSFIVSAFRLLNSWSSVIFPKPRSVSDPFFAYGDGVFSMNSKYHNNIALGTDPYSRESRLIASVSAWFPYVCFNLPYVE